MNSNLRKNLETYHGIRSYFRETLNLIQAISIFCLQVDKYRYSMNLGKHIRCLQQLLRKLCQDNKY